MAGRIAAAALKARLKEAGELALFDVRELGQYAEAHLFHAIPLPCSRFELDLGRLAPRKAVAMVLYDESGEGVADRAAQRAQALGYSDVQVLEGGAQGWKAAGHTLFAGVNVPSKTFGELVEHAHHTPRITAQDLQAMRERGDDFVIVDGRPLAEYRKMNIPGGICCPNGELALRIAAIAPDPRTRVVVNCAGRTRSIIGAQTLIDFGIRNPVVALENGTQGWFLAGYTLENGADRRYPSPPQGEALERLREQGRRFVERNAVPVVDARVAQAWLEDGTRTTYLFDVRTAEEYAAGHLQGAVHAPGGQLVQATDQWVGVRGARMILVDAEGVRAPLMAHWLRQLGHEAVVLKEGEIVAAPLAPDTCASLPVLAECAPRDLADALQKGGTTLLDLRGSMAYRKEHIPGARWAVRPRLPQVHGPVVLVADETDLARAAAQDLRESGCNDIRLLAGGIEAWRAAGLPLEASPEQPARAECIDFIFFTHGRHEGDAAAARQYLAWETQLLGQLDADERGSFRL
jgi:rhodanese-related sulfurtransferase